jgi:hypothetical protein
LALHQSNRAFLIFGQISLWSDRQSPISRQFVAFSLFDPYLVSQIGKFK